MTRLLRCPADPDLGRDHHRVRGADAAVRAAARVAGAVPRTPPAARTRQARPRVGVPARGRVRRGWTPCIGPVLAGVLAVAGSQGGSLRGALCCSCTRWGSRLPFLLVGVGIRKLMGALAFVKRNYQWIAGVSGVVMIAIGVLVATNLWTGCSGPSLPRDQRFQPAASEGCNVVNVGNAEQGAVRPRARERCQCAGPRCPSEVHAEGYRKGAQENGRGPGPGGPGSSWPWPVRRTRPSRRWSPRARTRRSPSTCSSPSSVVAVGIFVIVEGLLLAVRDPVPAPEEPDRPDPRAGPRQHPARDRVDDPADADPGARRRADDRDDLGPARPSPRATCSRSTCSRTSGGGSSTTRARTS